jgi:hypothetical protein
MIIRGQLYDMLKYSEVKEGVLTPKEKICNPLSPPGFFIHLKTACDH